MDSRLSDAVSRAGIALAVAILALAPPRPAQAQDSHYWANQYGSRAELVGGLVVGAFTDLSATYYNPGAIALVPDPSLILTTDAFEFINITFDEQQETQVSLTSQRLRPAPRMFAIQLPFRNIGQHRLAVSVLTRHDFDFEAQGMALTTAEEIEDGTAEEAASAELSARSRLSEGWLGLSWAHPLSDRVGIGVTNYFAIRYNRQRVQLLEGVVPQAGMGSSLTAFSDDQFWHVRALWKIGVGLDLSPLTLGITVTTPSVGLFGSGKTRANLTAINLDGETELAATDQEGLDVTYRNPLSVAGGLRYAFGRTAVYASAEWFGSQDAYTLVDGQPFVAQTSGDTLSSALSDASKSVFNWGIGLEREMSETVDLYAAFFTDRSAADPSNERDPISFATWDIFHVSAGSAFRIGTIDLTTGLSLGWGSDRIQREVTGAIVPGDVELEADANYWSLKLIVGLQFAL